MSDPIKLTKKQEHALVHFAQSGKWPAGSEAERLDLASKGLITWQQARKGYALSRLALTQLGAEIAQMAGAS